MIISDLQHIESAAETQVQGGRKRPKPPKYKQTYVAYSKSAPTEEFKLPGVSFSPLTYNVAGAQAGAEAVGCNTKTSTTTDTLVIEEQFSSSSSGSFSEAY